MLEERAILLGKLGRHEQALTIYTNILKDMPAALEYCNICFQSGSPANKEVAENIILMIKLKLKMILILSLGVLLLLETIASSE